MAYRDRQELFALARTLAGNISSMQQLASALTQMVMGAQMSDMPVETAGDLTSYAAMAGALRKML